MRLRGSAMRIALAAVLLCQAASAVSLFPQREPLTVSPPADTSPGIAGLLLPAEPSRPVCLPIMNRMGWDGCPIVLR